MIKRLSSKYARYFYIFLIIAIGIVLRFYMLGQNPPSLGWDEVSHGYNAYSILTTAKDEWGRLLPAIFRAYGDYKMPAMIYLVSVSEFLFGLSSFAIRLPAALCGVGTIIFTYLLTKRLFGQRIGLFSALFIAIEPWSLFLSRVAYQADIALFLIIAGTYYFLVGLKKHKYFILSSFLLGVSVWSYNIARIFTPLLVFSLIAVYFSELKALFKKQRNIVISSLIILAVFFVPMAYQLANPVGQARYGQVGLVDQGAINSINEARGKSDLPPFLNRAIHNKATYFAHAFIINFYSHFSPQFLFFNGGFDYQYSVPSHGLLYYLQIPFFILGLIALAFRKEKDRYLIVLWLIIGPVPSSLATGAPNVIRSVVMLPAPMILSALGVVAFYDFLKRRKVLKKYFVPEMFIVVYLGILGVFLHNYLINYFDNYKYTYSWSWQYGYKEAVDYVKDNYKEYDKIIVTKKYGEPHEFFLFYGAEDNAPWDWQPEAYRSDPNLIRFHQSNWYWVDRFGKFYFVNDWQIPTENDNFQLESGGKFNCEGEKCLLVTSPDNHPRGWTRLRTIYFLDGGVAFEIYENK